jgi:toxin ParE1/3/4
MPLRLRFAPLAERDLEEIGRYIARDNPREAGQFLTRIKDKCQDIAATPLIGRERDDMGRNVRSFPLGRYLIFYRVMGDDVVVVRVLHGARNLPDTFRAK